MNDTSHDTSRNSYIIWSFTFPHDSCLLCDNERYICLLQCPVFHNKTMHRVSYDISVYKTKTKIFIQFIP